MRGKAPREAAFLTRRLYTRRERAEALFAAPLPFLFVVRRILRQLLWQCDGKRRETMRHALEERYGELGTLGSVVDGDLVSFLRRAFPERHAGVSTVLAQDVVGHVDELELAHVVVVIAGDALERVKAGFERRHAVPHVLDDGVRSGHLDVLFPATGRSDGAHVLIGIATRSDDWRIAAAAGEFEREAAGGGAAGNFTFVVERRAVDSPGWRRQNAPDGGHAEFRFDAKLGGTLFEVMNALFPKFGLR